MLYILIFSKQKISEHAYEMMITAIMPIVIKIHKYCRPSWISAIFDTFAGLKFYTPS